MQIDTNLNLALPVAFSDGGEPRLWAYHTPISIEVFQANYRVIAATHAAIWTRGLRYAASAGLRIANLALLDAAAADAEEQGTPDSGQAILAEIRVRTLILAPSANGFDLVPADIAVTRGILDKEEWSEAEATLVFFTVSSSMAKRAGRKALCENIASVTGGSITSLPVMEFAATLATSTPDETSEVAEASSVPS